MNLSRPGHVSKPPHPVRGNGFLIVDDHSLIREGIVRVFSEFRPCAALFEARDLACAVAILQGPSGEGVDTILLDLNLPDSQGIETLRRIKEVAPDRLIGIISGTHDEHLAMQCLTQGASAFVPKHGEVNQLVQGLSALANGGVYFPRDLLTKVTGTLSDGNAGGPVPGDVPLTRRQREVLPMLLRGCTNQQISDELRISLETAKLHVSGLLRLYKVSSRVQLILACSAQNKPT